MESIKTCSVCFFSYDTKDYSPRSLPCGHTLCSNCLKNILRQPTLRKCPFDNQPFLQNSLAAFPLNFVIMDLLEQKNNNSCKTHAGEKLKFICLTDRVKICAKCAKQKSHYKHKIKKIKELKAQGAKVKRELQENLVNINDYEKEKAEDFEQIRKVFISVIDDQVKKVKNILLEKQFEWVQQVNNLFNADQKNDSEGLFAFKKKMNETIKNITDACQDENGDLILLNKEVNNTDQRNAKKRPQFFKDQSSRVQEKILQMQKSLKDSLDSSRIAFNSISLMSQDVVKEIYSKNELSQEELTERHKKLKYIKFMSHYDIEIDSGCLNISFKHSQQKEIEVNLDDFQGIRKVVLQYLRCDGLKNEPSPNILSYIFHGLKKLVDLTISFDPRYFNNEGLLWLGNKIQNHVDHLEKTDLHFSECKFDDDTMTILCNQILSKTIKLNWFGLNLISCAIIDTDLETLAKSLRPFRGNLTFFALAVNSHQITDNGIQNIFEVIKEMEKLNGLHLYLSCKGITDESFKIFGKSVLPSLKNLLYLTLALDKSRILDEGFCAILKRLPDLRGLKLCLSHTLLTDNSIEMFIEKVLPRLELPGFFDFQAQGTQISEKNLGKIQEILETSERKRAEDESEN